MGGLCYYDAESHRRLINLPRFPREPTKPNAPAPGLTPGAGDWSSMRLTKHYVVLDVASTDGVRTWDRCEGLWDAQMA